MRVTFRMLLLCLLIISPTHAVSKKTYNRSCQGYTKHKRNLSDEEDLFDHGIAKALKDVCNDWDYVKIPVTYNKSLHCFLDWAILHYYYNYDPINHDPIYWIPWFPGYEKDSKLAAEEFRLQRGLAFCDAMLIRFPHIVCRVYPWYSWFHGGRLYYLYCLMSDGRR